MRGSFPEPTVYENAAKFAGMIKAHLKDMGAANEPLGVDIAEIPVLRALEAEGIRVVDGQQTILNAEAIKTPEEVELIETAISIVEAAFWEVISFARPGVRENEINGLMRNVMYRLGAEEIQNINVITGDRSHPHPHDASDRLLRMGDMIFIDVVTAFNGYRTCYYQTFVTGKPSQKQLDVYKKTYDWLFNAIALIKPGITTADVAAVWPDAREVGLANEAEAFALELGHGIGITHWAKPVISRMFSFDHRRRLRKEWYSPWKLLRSWQRWRTNRGNGRSTKDGYRMLSKFPSKNLISCPASETFCPDGHPRNATVFQRLYWFV